jgi:hypothetical protein
MKAWVYKKGGALFNPLSLTTIDSAKHFHYTPAMSDPHPNEEVPTYLDVTAHWLTTSPTTVSGRSQNEAPFPTSSQLVSSMSPSFANTEVPNPHLAGDDPQSMSKEEGTDCQIDDKI